MKKIYAAMATFLACTALCVGCGEQDSAPKMFGMFSYNGHYLTTYAVQEISGSEAKTIVQNNYATSQNAYTAAKIASAVQPLSVNPSQPYGYPAPSADLVDSLMLEYASVEVTTKYYKEDGKAKPKTDLLQGTDFKSMVTVNEIAPFSQLVARGVVIFDELIDYMEEQNEIFLTSEDATLAPFRSIFSYHTDKTGNIVIQTRDFAELPSSVGGGVGCSYRQDTEIVYDEENKMTKWQTSLGVYTAAPTGTLKQGYILEVELKWNPKV